MVHIRAITVGLGEIYARKTPVSLLVEVERLLQRGPQSGIKVVKSVKSGYSRLPVCFSSF